MAGSESEGETFSDFGEDSGDEKVQVKRVIKKLDSKGRLEIISKQEAISDQKRQSAKVVLTDVAGQLSKQRGNIDDRQMGLISLHEGLTIRMAKEGLTPGHEDGDVSDFDEDEIRQEAPAKLVAGAVDGFSTRGSVLAGAAACARARQGRRLATISGRPGLFGIVHEVASEAEAHLQKNRRRVLAKKGKANLKSLNETTSTLVAGAEDAYRQLYNAPLVHADAAAAEGNDDESTDVPMRSTQTAPSALHMDDTSPATIVQSELQKALRTLARRMSRLSNLLHEELDAVEQELDEEDEEEARELQRQGLEVPEDLPLARRNERHALTESRVSRVKRTKKTTQMLRWFKATLSEDSSKWTAEARRISQGADDADLAACEQHEESSSSSSSNSSSDDGEPGDVKYPVGCKVHVLDSDGVAQIATVIRQRKAAISLQYELSSGRLPNETLLQSSSRILGLASDICWDPGARVVVRDEGGAELVYEVGQTCGDEVFIRLMGPANVEHNFGPPRRQRHFGVWVRKATLCVLRNATPEPPPTPPRSDPAWVPRLSHPAAADAVVAGEQDGGSIELRAPSMEQTRRGRRPGPSFLNPSARGVPQLQLWTVESVMEDRSRVASGRAPLPHRWLPPAHSAASPAIPRAASSKPRTAPAGSSRSASKTSSDPTAADAASGVSAGPPARLELRAPPIPASISMLETSAQTLAGAAVRPWSRSTPSSRGGPRRIRPFDGPDLEAEVARAAREHAALATGAEDGPRQAEREVQRAAAAVSKWARPRPPRRRGAPRALAPLGFRQPPGSMTSSQDLALGVSQEPGPHHRRLIWKPHLAAVAGGPRR